MAEISYFWAGDSVGDCGPYTDDDLSDVWAIMFVRDNTAQGVIEHYANRLAVSGVTSPVSVATGAALVDGKFYKNTSPKSVTVPTPSSQTRIDRIVLRKDFTAQTVRVTRIAGTEGAGVPPDIVQSDGTTWDIKLAQVSIEISGVTTCTDERELIAFGVPSEMVFYTTLDSLPLGYSEFTAARGRVIVGLPNGGTSEGTVGTALSDLEDKEHVHVYTTVPRHSHTVSFDETKTGTGLYPQVGGYYAADRTIETSYAGSTSPSTESASHMMPYIQLMAVIKD